MFAIAWKEYRQTRLVALALLGVLLAIYFGVWASPWVEYRFGALLIGVPILLSLLGGHAFSEEKRVGTDAFLRALPLGPYRRWLASAGTNLVLTISAVAVFILVVSFSGGAGPFLEDKLSLRDGMGLLLVLGAVWSVAVFWSTAVKNSVLAMICALCTGFLAVVFAASAAEYISAMTGSGFGDHREVMIMPISAASLALFLAASLAFEVVDIRRLAVWKRIAAVAVVLSIPAMVIVGVLTHAAVSQAKALWMADPRLGAVVATPGDRSSLLVTRGRVFYRLLRLSPEGRWRRYDVRVADPYHYWISDDGKTLAFNESIFVDDPAAIVGGALRAAVTGNKPYGVGEPHQHPIRLLDLDTGELARPQLPFGKGFNVRPLGWTGEPTRFIAVVDALDEKTGEIAESDLYTIAPDGQVLGKRSLEEMRSFRNLRERMKTPTDGLISATNSSLFRSGSNVVAVQFARTSKDERLHRRHVICSYMIYDMETGQARKGRIEDPRRHTGFSASFAWAVALDTKAESQWTVKAVGAPWIPKANEGWVSLERAGEGEPPWRTPPALRLSGKERNIPICEVSAWADEACVSFTFLRDERLFFALVKETASQEAPGFEPVEYVPSPDLGGEAQLVARRVRAVAIDLETGVRREAALSANVVSFFVGPRQDRIFCHGSRYEPVVRSGVNDRVTILDLPDLETRASFSWPEGNGPLFLFSFLFSRTPPVFLAHDEVATVSHDELSVWRIGPEPPRKIELPSLESEGSSEW